MADGTLAEQLAALTASTALADVPDEVIERTKLHLLDQLGAQLAGSSLPTSRLIMEYAAGHGAAGPSTVAGSNLRLDAEFAGFANGTSGHAFETDDYSLKANTHPGCEVVPAALAAAEESDADGASLLRAITVGFEVAVRVGLATMPSMLRDRGFHENCPHGAIASAIAVGLLRSVTPQQQVMALSIAASHASGTTEYAASGGEVKRIHAGLGAIGGIRSVRLAELGLTGPATIFEGDHGFFRAFTDRYDEAQLCGDWARRWQFARLSGLKSHCCVAAIHPHIDALAGLRTVRGFDPADVAEITLGIDPQIIGHVSRVGPQPSDIVGAQFSAEFSVAMSLVRGSNGIPDYEWAQATGFADPEVARLAHRIRLESDQACASDLPDAPVSTLGRVRVRLADGEELRGSGFARGSPDRPLSRAEVERKYQALAGRVIPRSQAERLAAAVLQIQDVASVREMAELLRMP